MGRLRNIANAGFYPWLEEHFLRVAAQLTSPASGSWMFDPCAGEGKFARFLSHKLGMKLATIEINTERGELCKAVSDHHVTGDALQAECGHGQFAFLWLNPPFMSDAEARMEWRFLRRFDEALVPGGVLAYTIPGHTMRTDRAILAHLVRNYENHRLFWLPEPNPYGQILYLGVRRQAKADDTREAKGLMEALTTKPVYLPDTCDQPLPIPNAPRPTIRLRGREIDWDDFRQEAAQYGVKLTDELQPYASLEAETVLPLKKGHLVSVLAGGGLDNARLGDDVIRGYVRQEEVQVECDDEDVVSLTRTVYHSQIVAFNPATGKYQVFEEGTGLGDYMLDHATELTELVKSRFHPRYEFDMRVVPEKTRRIIHTLGITREPVPGKPRGLWPGQRHVLAALERSWNAGHRCLIAVCDMGWGKSLLGAGAIAVNHAATNRKPAWFVTEAHLVDQMVEEVKATWPLANVTRIDTIEEARYFLRSYETASAELKARRPWVAVIGKQKLKNGCGWKVAIRRFRRKIKGDGGGTTYATFYRCPDCGRLQVYRNGEKQGIVVSDDDAYFADTPRECCYEVSQEETKTVRKGCGARLWQFSREIGGTDGKGQAGFAGIDSKRKAAPGKVRWPLVKWLSKQHPDKVGTVVVDEVHEYKGQSTDAGYALGELIGLADRTLLMTGTLFGGYASTVFFIAYRANPAFRHRFGFTDVQRFVEQYGVLEKKTVEREYEGTNRGVTTLQSRRQTYVKELPGVSPSLITLFLDFTLFSSLSDLGIKLPDVERRILPVTLGKEHRHAYDIYKDSCIRAMKEAMDATTEDGEPIRLAGAFLHTLRGYTVAPWRREELRDKWGASWAWAPNLELVDPGNGGPKVVRQRIFAPERALLDELRAQVGQGRRVVVFVDQTRTRNIVTTRLIPLCEQEGLQAIFCDVDAKRRGEWIAKHAPYCDVMFVNPRGVKTGLNLVQFATAIFFEIPYSLYVFKQAAARPRRPTQTQKVEIVYMSEDETIMAQALELMFEKLTASAIFRGETVVSVMDSAAGSGSFLSELMKRVVENAKVDNLEAMFARYNKLEADNEGYFQDYDLSSYETVETVSRRKTVVTGGPVKGKQLPLV